MNKIQECLYHSDGDAKPQIDILKAVIEEIERLQEKLQEESRDIGSFSREEEIYWLWYMIGLSKIQQLLEDSIK